MRIFKSQEDLRQQNPEGCEECGAIFDPTSTAYAPSGRTPINGHTYALSSGRIAWASYCAAHGGQGRALRDLQAAI